MSIYIISNRAVESPRGQRKRFKEDGREHARPTFRIARAWVEKGAEKADYELLRDGFDQDFEKLSKALGQKKASDTAPNNMKGSEALFYELYQTMLKSREIPADVLFFIHGFANAFSDNLAHIARLKELFLDPDSSPTQHLVYVSWPTRSSKLLTYENDQRDARVTGMVLARLYDKLQAFFRAAFLQQHLPYCGHRIHLACHSMGNQVLMHMLENLRSEDLEPFFSEVLLLHSDVPNTVFDPGEPFTRLEMLAERTHVYMHRSDDALWISRFTKNGNKRLGRKGPRDRSVLSQETFLIDVSHLRKDEALRERIADHWGYLESPQEIEDIRALLRGEEAPSIDNRHLRRGESQYYYLVEDGTSPDKIRKITGHVNA